MLTTTRQLAKLAQVSEQTVRNYTREYGVLLSAQARGEAGTRLFDDEDISIFRSIVALRKEGVPPTEVIGRIRRGDIYIDHTTPQQTTQSPQTALEAPQALMLVRSDLQRQIDAIRRSQDVLLRVAVLWGMLWGAVAALAVGGFVLWLLWLLAR